MRLNTGPLRLRHLPQPPQKLEIPGWLLCVRAGMLARTRLCVLAGAGGLAALAVTGAVVGAQTAVGPAPVDQNCAVSTARIGSVDVTEFFGIRGGPSSFTQNFGAAPAQTPSTQPEQPLVQRCIRLEVENPSPGDLLPVGGYVMAGFAFDPTIGASGGSGITGIQVFLDDPNQGGAVLGQVGATSTSGASNSGDGFGLASSRGAAFNDQFGTSGFRLTIRVPPSASGNQHAIFVLAQSTSGRTGTVAVPVIVGNLTPAVATRTP